MSDLDADDGSMLAASHRDRESASNLRRPRASPGTAASVPVLAVSAAVGRRRRRCSGRRTVNVLPVARAGAGRLDLAAVLVDDPVADGQPQAGALAGPAAVKNGSKMFSSTSGVMPQPVSVKTISA